MKAKALWQVSVTSSREAEEAVAALLERLFGKTAAIYTDESSQTSVATVYSANASDRVLSKREALEAGLNFLAGCGLELGSAKVSIRKVPRENWTTSWKKHFKIIEIGAALLIKPSWNKRKARQGQAVVVLDPGLSFGTGQHPTTAFCLEHLVKTRKTGQAQSFLDMGTGSGILAIAAAKVGYRPVRAFDHDPAAVRIAKANARRNRVAERISFVRRDLAQLPPAGRIGYDLVCANLTSDLLIHEASRICHQIRDHGSLILAGVLTTQFPEVQEVYERAGLELRETRVEGEWKSGWFVGGKGKPAPN
jgi:ribosomal protein L11 methyltransferase